MSYQGAHTGAELDDAVGVAKGAGTGLVVKTATGEGVRRSFTASANLALTNGDGVLGDIGLDLSAAVIASLAKADTALQEAALATVATTGAYADLVDPPLLGTMAGEATADYTPTAGLGSAAFTDSTAYATAAQGALADSAVQPEDLGTAATTDSTAYATAAQGGLADTAVQPGDATAVPYVAVAADKTLALTDANTEQQVEAAAVLTIPTNATAAFARGDKVAILSVTAGAVSVTASAGVTINGVDAGSATLTGQYSGAVITKIGADAWAIAGDIGEVL